MHTRLVPWLLSVAVVFAAPILVAQQAFDVVVSGGDASGGCFILPISQSVVQWYDPDRIDNDDVSWIASADGRRVLAVLPGSPLRIVEIRPDGTQVPFYSGAPAFGMSMAIASNGTVFVAVGGVSPALVRISPAGTLEATYPLTTDNIAVGPDGCTIYYRTGAGDIGRINGCTGAALPDFAALTWISDLEVLSDGQVLVSWGSQVDLYDASGAFVRVVADLSAYGLSDHETDAIAVHGGVLFVAALDRCAASNSLLLRVALSDGSEILRAPLEMTSASAIVVNAAALAIPTLGEVAFALLVLALAAGGAFVLKLR